METRRRFLAGLGSGALAVGAGCTGSAADVEREDTAVRATAFEFRRVEQWVAGTTTEHAGALVVDGDIENVGEEERPAPPITATFSGADGSERGRATAVYRRETEQVPSDEAEFAVAAGETAAFRLVHEPNPDAASYVLYLGT